jgi:hypothetical protein
MPGKRLGVVHPGVIAPRYGYGGLGTTRRWDGYNYFPNNPEQMLEWFSKYMG